MVKMQYSSNTEMCLPVDVRPRRNIPWDIHDYVQLHAQRQPVPRVGNEWSDVCAPAQYSQLVHCSPD
jgi:hypothetical protein